MASYMFCLKWLIGNHFFVCLLFLAFLIVFGVCVVCDSGFTYASVKELICLYADPLLVVLG